MMKYLFCLLFFSYYFIADGQVVNPFSNVNDDADLLAYWYNIPQDSMHLKVMDKTFYFYSTLEVYGKVNHDSFKLRVEAYLEDNDKILDEEFIVTNNKAAKGCQLTIHDGCFKLVYPVAYAEKKPWKIIVTLIDSHGKRQKEIYCRYHKFHGRVYDFNGNPFRAFISVRPDDFHFNTSVWSDSLGYFALELPERTYNDIAVANEDYGIDIAEAWAWHVILDADQKMDFKIGTGEVYNLNVWPNNGGGNTFLASFRPMSLHLFRNSGTPGTIEVNNTAFSYTELTPDLSPENVKVTVNGEQCDVISLQEYYETADGYASRAYLVQIDRKKIPKAGKQNLLLEYDVKTFNDNKEINHNGIGYFQFITNFSGLSGYN